MIRPMEPPLEPSLPNVADAVARMYKPMLEGLRTCLLSACVAHQKVPGVDDIERVIANHGGDLGRRRQRRIPRGQVSFRRRFRSSPRRPVRVDPNPCRGAREFTPCLVAKASRSRYVLVALGVTTEGGVCSGAALIGTEAGTPCGEFAIVSSQGAANPVHCERGKDRTPRPLAQPPSHIPRRRSRGYAKSSVPSTSCVAVDPKGEKPVVVLEVTTQESRGDHRYSCNLSNRVSDEHGARFGDGRGSVMRQRAPQPNGHDSSEPRLALQAAASKIHHRPDPPFEFKLRHYRAFFCLCPADPRPASR